MINVIKKIYSDDKKGLGPFAEVTVDSIQNLAILVGTDITDSRVVVYWDEVDGLIEALQKLKEYL